MLNKNRPTTLYRAFDNNGRLLYVGISKCLPERIGAHKIQSLWFEQAAQITLEHFASRDQALEAECAAIVAERPVYNTLHSCNRPLSFGGRRKKPSLKDSIRIDAIKERSIRFSQAESDDEKRFLWNEMMEIAGWDQLGK